MLVSSHSLIFLDTLVLLTACFFFFKIVDLSMCFGYVVSVSE
jgi:hypothetical protein